jgi:hypothetical protein
MQGWFRHTVDLRLRAGAFASTVQMRSVRERHSRVCIVAAVAICVSPAQTLRDSMDFTRLSPVLAASFNMMGGRMTSAANAEVALTGVTTDANGTRSGQIVVQSSGLMSYRESQSYSLIFDGTKFTTKSGQSASGDEPIQESLLAHLPDAVFLQFAAGGGLRKIGAHFRTDDGKSPGYTGPYWTLLGFSPRPRAGMTPGTPLQAPLFVAIDEKTGLIAEIRTTTLSNGVKRVVQTRFASWTQQGSQWFPSSIIRMENGKQTLSFTLQSATVRAASPRTAFEP